MKQLLSTIIERIRNYGWVTYKGSHLKTSLVLSTVLICMIASLCSGVQHTQTATHTLAIVFDTSPTDYDTELRWAALAFYRNCTAGDRVLFFVVRGKNTRLMFSCTKTLQESEFADITAIINDVDHDWFAHADISTALSGPVYQQLRQYCGQNDRAIVAVISTGNFSNEQSRDICRFGSTIKDNNKWTLVITGLVDKTPRQIFLSATKGELYWYNLTDTIYDAMVDRWLKDIKYELTDKQSQPNASKSGSNETNPIINVPNKTGNTTAQNQQSKAEVVTQPSQGKSPVAGSPPTVKPNTSLSKSPNADAHTKASPPTKTPAYTAKNINAPHPHPHQGLSGTPPKDNRFGANIMRWREFISPLLAMAGVVIAGILLLIAWRSWSKAKNWKKTAKQRIDAFTNKPRSILEILMAQVGEASYRLGNLQHFRQVFVGNSAKNAIRIYRKGIIDRHLKIYRRFSVLWVKNLSKKPVMLNGHQLPAGKKMKLLLPAEIIVCEGVVIRLFISKPDASKTTQLQEAFNGTRK